MSVPANELTAAAAAAAIRDGSLSAVELITACLARIDAREAVVGAWAFLDRDGALEAARAADAARSAGAALGPLHGVPVGIKDVIDTAAIPTEHGSPIFRGRIPEHDAACVALLRRAGAILLGKTVTTELANTHPGRTRNPHNPEHTPGGSSSGSGAAVADLHVPLALGTQTGGSVIRPASFCGVYALKPTLGLIPREGVLMQSHTLDTVGVFARSITDLALLTDCLSRHEARDPYSHVDPRPNLSGILAHAPELAPRVAFLRTPAWASMPSTAQTVLESLVRSLGEACREESLPPPFDRVTEHHVAVMGPESLYYYGPHLEATPQQVSADLRSRLEAAKQTTAREYIAALQACEAIYASLERLFDRYDAILCPASAGPAPRGLGDTGSRLFNGLWTYLGVPCVNVPGLRVDGLPMGVQLVGLRGEEARLLRVARWLERAMTG